MRPREVTCILGTRPEAIKLAPVIAALKHDRRFICRVCVTAQHRQMLDQTLADFDISADTDLDIMRSGQALAGLTSRLIEAVDLYLEQNKPELLLVQGDTTTVFCAALAAFYRKVPVGHVEAGLRTGDLSAPWPEEANRVLTSRLAGLHFAPTEQARQNLMQEGIASARIYVTGNTVIDALFLALEKVSKNPPPIPGLPGFLAPAQSSASELLARTDHLKPQIVLITGHRRENFGRGFESICRAISELAQRFPKVHFVYPVHLNPKVREPVLRMLKDPASGAVLRENIHLIEPLPYLSFVALMKQATIILTDSGGIQEEAPSLGKPVLVMREATERPEAVAAGTVRLVGTDSSRITLEVGRLLEDPQTYAMMSSAHNPYGDGLASGRILDACHTFLQTHAST